MRVTIVQAERLAHALAYLEDQLQQFLLQARFLVQPHVQRIVYVLVIREVEQRFTGIRHPGGVEQAGRAAPAAAVIGAGDDDGQYDVRQVLQPLGELGCGAAAPEEDEPQRPLRRKAGLQESVAFKEALVERLNGLGVPAWRRAAP